MSSRRHTARPTDKGRERKRETRPVSGRCPTTGKLSFDSRAKARKELKSYQGSRPVRSVYLCPCGKWHLTKQRRSAAAHLR